MSHAVVVISALMIKALLSAILLGKGFLQVGRSKEHSNILNVILFGTADLYPDKPYFNPAF